MVTQGKREPISSVLPPLIFGCATFNVQYNKDPYVMDTQELVKQALLHGIRAFDTSPYYGPSEVILSNALQSEDIRHSWPRESYTILTKVGRISADEFDYSPEWVQQSINRSLQRLKTSYLDVVYCHDTEYVSPEETLGAVKELRRIRDEQQSIKYVGISGYPIDVLASLAERILRETGEPIDIVQTYGHCTVQNTTAVSVGAERFRAAGVVVVTNASPLAMGLIRRSGPYTEGGDWHPSPMELRAAVKRASDYCDEQNEAIETVALRYCLEHWLKAGSIVGSYGNPPSGIRTKEVETIEELGGEKLGVTVFGVSNMGELSNMMALWRSILDGAETGQQTANTSSSWKKTHEESISRRKTIQSLAARIKEILGDYYDYSWVSPPTGFVNARNLDPHSASSRKGPRLGEYVEPKATSI